jgi:hypothetical protein
MVGGEPMSTLRVNRIEPRTGSKVEIVGFSSDQPSFYAEMTGGNLSVSNNVDTKVPLSSTLNRVDTDNLLDANGKFTATASTAGIWRFTGQVNGIETSGNHWLDNVFAMIFKNGTAISEGTDSIHSVGGSYGKFFQTQTFSLIQRVEAGDYLELYGRVGHSPDSGASGSPLVIQQRSTNFTGNRISS